MIPILNVCLVRILIFPHELSKRVALFVRGHDGNARSSRAATGLSWQELLRDEQVREWAL